MTKTSTPTLSSLVQNFFCQRLQAQQQVSPHTLASYRDTLRLLLAFVQQKTARPPAQQTLQDWNGPTILDFLDHLEKQRGCQARTRNVRLAALRAFMRYVSQQAPDSLALASQVLAIPLKRFDRPLVRPLSVPEVEAILAATDPSTPAGGRDHLLFNLLYHTGARVSEALQLRCRDILWGPPSVVCFHGKGRKERSIPLLKPLVFRCTIIWEKTIVIIWANPLQARESVSAWPQFPLMCAAGMRGSGIWEVEQRLFRALVGGASACITRCGLAASDASRRDAQTAARSRRMPLYYGERSWNSLKLRSFLQVVDAGGFTPMTYATSHSDMNSGVMTEREENPPLTSVISVQRNTLGPGVKTCAVPKSQGTGGADF